MRGTVLFVTAGVAVAHRESQIVQHLISASAQGTSNESFADALSRDEAPCVQ